MFDQAELQWTDNPAWIFYDLVTNKRYGLGKYGLKAGSIDKWNLYEIAKYCDEKVKTGLDPKYASRKFHVIRARKRDYSKFSITAGEVTIKIEGFSNQKQFEVEFPEYSTIALHDLNDESEPVHRRIKYLRRAGGHSARGVFIGGEQSDSKAQNERYSPSDQDKLISYKGADKDSAGHAIIVIQKILSTEECYRIQPGLEAWVRGKKASLGANRVEKNARERDLIFQFMDDADERAGAVTRSFDVGQKINSTSVSGLAATEFYGNFDILEPRFSANLYITSQVDGYKMLNDIASIFRGITYFANGKVFAYFDKKRDPIFNFTNANVKDGLFVYSGSSKSSRFTTCVVRYVDKYENYKPRVEYVEDPDGIVKYGIIEKELVAFGCASRSQAKRLGKWFLFSSQYETDFVEFSAGKECGYMRPGDVINVIDKTRTQKRFGGRVVDFVSGEHKIKVDLNLSEDYVGENIHITIVDDFELADSLSEKVDQLFIDEDGKIDQKTVTDEEIANIRKSQVKTYKIKSIEADTSLVPVENRIVELESVGGDPATDFGKIKIGSIFILNQKDSDLIIQENSYKLVNISQINDLEYKIQAMQYVESKFDVADNKADTKINLKYSRSPVEYSRPAKPIGVPRISMTSLSKGLERELRIAWDAVDPAPDKYKIVVTLQGGLGMSKTSRNQAGTKIVLEKNAKDSSGKLVDTSVSVNIQDYTGDVEVTIYSVDSEGNLDLIYY
jgi:hypothetical protein